MSKQHHVNKVQLSVVLTLLISGCSTLKPSLPTLPVTSNGELTQWSLRGKIGWRNEQHAESAYLNWLQCGEKFQIRLSGPLGQGAVRLYGDQQQLTLETRDGKRHHSHHPEQLLYQQLGWQLPLQQLIYWVRGIPASQTTYLATANNSFIQSEWQLHFPRYLNVGNRTLPAKTIAQRHNTKITLITKDWDLQPDCSKLP